MRWFVRGAAAYNASGVLFLLVPGALGLVGVAEPYSPFWIWLPGLLGIFATIVLLLSSTDLSRYGSFPYWNGIVRLLFVIVTFAAGFAETMGYFAVLLALGDLVLAAGCLFGLPRALGRTHWQLLTNAADQG